MALENVMRVDNGNIVGPSMPDTYPASQVMMSDGETSVEDAIDAHTFGTEQTLTYNTEYTTTKDGYFKVKIDSSTTLYYVQGYVNGKTFITLSSANGLYNEGTVFVRKGSVIKHSGSNSSVTHGYFYPLQ